MSSRASLIIEQNIIARSLDLCSESPLTFGADIAQLVSQALQAVVKRLASEADGLNRLDAVSGDGDTGSAFKRAGEAIARDLANGKLVLNRPSSLFRRLGLIAESRMGGTCGASNDSWTGEDPW